MGQQYVLLVRWPVPQKNIVAQAPGDFFKADNDMRCVAWPFAHPEGDTWNELDDGRRAWPPRIDEDLETAQAADVSLDVETAAPPPSTRDALLAPLPAANPAPTLAATMSLNDCAPVECRGATASDSKDSSSVEFGALASPPGPTLTLPPPPFATAAATAAAGRVAPKSGVEKVDA